MSLGKRINETGYPARSERRYMGGTVLSVDNAMYVATVDVGATDVNGNPIYKMAAFNPATPPHAGDRVQFVYTNSNPHSGMIVGGQLAGTNPVQLNGVLPHPLLDNANDSDTVAHTPVAGDLIYANATPKWQALPGGSPGQILAMSAGSPPVPVWENPGVSIEANGAVGVGPEQVLNFIPGTNIASITAVDNTSASPHRVDITINGQVAYWPYVTESANYSVPTTNTTPGVLVNSTSTGIVVTLPTSASVGAGFVYYLKNYTGEHPFTVAVSGSDTIDGVTSLTLWPGDAYVLVCGGANNQWYPISAYRPHRIVSVTGVSASTYTIADHDDEIVGTPAATATITLCDAALWKGRQLGFKLQSGTSLILSPVSSQTIDGASSYTLSMVGGYVQILSDGSNWRILATGGLASGSDTDPVFVASGASHAAGIVPDPGATAGTTRFLREDATWAVPPAGSDPVFGGSGASHAAGDVPDPGATAGTTRFLREDATWAAPPTQSDPVFVASGASHAAGDVPDPGSTAGTTRFLREDATWDVPAVFGASGASHSVGYVPDPGATAGTTRYLREDGTWVAPSGGGTTSPLTTKGDIWGYGTGDTRIPVGSDSKVLIADSSQADGVVWNYRPTIVLSFQPGTTEAAWTIPTTTTELLGLTIHRSQFDLTNFSQIRLSVTKSAAQSSVHGILDVEYSTNGGSTWSSMDGSGNPSGQISGMTAGVNTTSWATLAAAAKADVLLRITGSAGSGGAANFGVIVVEAR